MALTYTENADSRAHLGPSCIVQENVVQPAAADYPTGGYPINPQNWGMGLISGLVPIAYTGTAVNYLWEFIQAAAGTATPTFAGYLYVQSAPGTQVAANTDLSGGTVKLRASGF